MASHIGQLPANTLNPQLATLYSPAKKSLGSGSLTWSGLALFAISLLVALSAYERFRISVGPLMVHAYLIPLAPLFLYVLVMRREGFPLAPAIGLLIFTVMYSFSTLPGRGPVPEMVKVIASSATIFAVALLVRSDRDFRLAVVGLMIAMCYLSFRGIASKHEHFTGANPLEGANENAFSLYTLAPLLLAGYTVLDRGTSKIVRVLLIAMSLVVILAMFSNANRSGWLGIGLIGLMLMSAKGQRMRGMMMLALMLPLGVFLVFKYGDVDLLMFRFGETFTGHTADTKRVGLFLACVRVGLENPILGVSPQNLKMHIGRYIGENRFLIDPHNVFGYLIGGAGLIVTGALFYIGYSLFRRPRGLSQKTTDPSLLSALSAHRLLRMMVVLWFVRGIFSREILYSSGFCMGLGLAIGLCIARGVWRQPKQTSQLPIPAKATSPGPS